MYQLMNEQLMYVVWNKCYRSDILKNNQILFKTYNSCEDRIFNLHYYEYCHQVIMNPKVEYIYEFEGGKGSLINTDLTSSKHLKNSIH